MYFLIYLLFSAMCTGCQEGQISIISRTDQAHTLLQMLQAQETGSLYNEGYEGEIP